MAYFYGRVLSALLADGTITRDDKVVVLCGGSFDRNELLSLGFADATISNLDTEMGNDIAPLQWSRIDAEQIDLPDGSVDVAIVHAGLHHCRSPHKALCEMLRIARKAVIVMEARDSFVMRTAERFGMTSSYELEAVALSNNSGGVRNSAIPNYIYRWTESEVRKTVESARPEAVNGFQFFYGLRLPDRRLEMSGGLKRFVAALLFPVARLVAALAPGQGNEFGFVITSDGCKPWISGEAGNLALDPSYQLGFEPSRYRRDP